MRRTIAITAVGLLAAGGAILTANPSTAATVVSSNLGVAGPVTSPCLTPSPTVNAPAGSTVRFSSSLLGDPVSAALYAPAVKITLTPAGASKSTELIISPGNNLKTADFKVPSGGTIPFTYTTGNASAGNGGVLGGVINLVNGLLGNFSASTKASTAVQAKWTGKIVVGSGSNACEVAPQLPGVRVSPSVPGVTLPGISVPGVQVPGVTVPNTPSLPGLGGGTKTTAPTKPSGTQTYLNYKPGGTNPAAGVVPQGYGGGSGSGGPYVAPGLSDSVNAPALPNGAKPASDPSTIKRGTSGPVVDIAASRPKSALAALSGVLVALAVVALAVATALWARTFLLHRPAKPAA